MDASRVSILKSCAFLRLVSVCLILTTATNHFDLYTKQCERVNNFVFIRESLASQGHLDHLDPLGQLFP